MRIGINGHLLAFTSNYRQAGLSRHIEELLYTVPRQAPGDSFVAFMSRDQVTDEFLANKPPNLTLDRSRFPTLKAPVRIAWEQTLLPIAAARRRLDLLHCPVNVRPAISPCPVVVTIHDLIFLRYPKNYRPAKRLYLRIMTGWSARHATHVIAVSEATRRDAIGLLRVPARRVTTVYNGVGSQFEPYDGDALAAFRHEKGITGRVVLYVGTLEPRKKVTTAIEAFSRIASDPGLDDTVFMIAGSKGWYYDEVFAAAQNSGLTREGRVQFLGRVPDDELPLWYNVAAVFAYPSQYEGFGLPALEAMACGTPVITSNVSALPEVVGDAGILVGPEDIDGWADGLRKLLTDTRLAAELRRKGIEQAGRFTWERTARETLQVYQRVLARKKRGRKSNNGDAPDA